MTAITPTRMTIAYDNVIAPTNIDSISPSNLTAVPGFSVDNLQYPDPGRLFKFDATAPWTPKLQINFSTQQSVGCVGIMRHNLNTANLDTSPGVLIDIDAGIGNVVDEYARHDLDTLFLFSPVGINNLTIEFTVNSGSGTFYIGAIYAGVYQELTTNPTDGLLEISRESSIAVQESSGGSRHFLSLGDRDRWDMSFETRRAREADVLLFNKTLQGIESRHKMVGVIYPWETHAVGVTDMPHFFGYVDKVRTKPRFSAATDPRFDLAVDFIGA